MFPAVLAGRPRPKGSRRLRVQAEASGDCLPIDSQGHLGAGDEDGNGGPSDLREPDLERCHATKSPCMAVHGP